MTTEEISDDGTNDDELPGKAPEEGRGGDVGTVRGAHRIGPVAGRVRARGDEQGATTGVRPSGALPPLPKRPRSERGTTDPEPAVPLITLPKILTELDLTLAQLVHRLSLVTEQLSRQGVLTSSARRLRGERDQLTEEIHQRRNLRALALRGRL